MPFCNAVPYEDTVNREENVLPFFPLSHYTFMFFLFAIPRKNRRNNQFPSWRLISPIWWVIYIFLLHALKLVLAQWSRWWVWDIAWQIWYSGMVRGWPWQTQDVFTAFQTKDTFCDCSLWLDNYEDILYFIGPSYTARRNVRICQNGYRDSCSGYLNCPWYFVPWLFLRVVYQDRCGFMHATVN